MNRLPIIAIFLLLPFAGMAQKDLTDPSYIYRLEDKNATYYIQKAPPNYGTAVLLDGKLTKHVGFSVFSLNRNGINCRWKYYTKPSKISRYTNDPSIKNLYVVNSRARKK